MRTEDVYHTSQMRLTTWPTKVPQAKALKIWIWMFLLTKITNKWI